MKTTLTILTALILISLGSLARADEHVAEIDISVTHGSIGSHFSIYHGNKTVDVDGKVYKIPFTSDFTKIANRDDDSTPITPDKPWKTTIKFSGGGRFILDISDWRDHPTATVLLKIDGVGYFKGSGSADNFDKWSDKQYGKGVMKKDDREIAFDLP